MILLETRLLLLRRGMRSSLCCHRFPNSRENSLLSAAATMHGHRQPPTMSASKTIPGQCHRCLFAGACEREATQRAVLATHHQTPGSRSQKGLISKSWAAAPLADVHAVVECLAAAAAAAVWALAVPTGVGNSNPTDPVTGVLVAAAVAHHHVLALT